MGIRKRGLLAGRQWHGMGVEYLTRVVVESHGSQFSNYFLEPGETIFSNSENRSESQTIDLRAVESPPVTTRLLSIDRSLICN